MSSISDDPALNTLRLECDLTLEGRGGGGAWDLSDILSGSTEAERTPPPWGAMPFLLAWGVVLLPGVVELGRRSMGMRLMLGLPTGVVLGMGIRLRVDDAPIEIIYHTLHIHAHTRTNGCKVWG